MSLLTVLGCYYGQECQEKPGKTVLQEDRRLRVHVNCQLLLSPEASSMTSVSTKPERVRLLKTVA